MKKGVQPEGNPNYYYVNIEAPPGATLADMHVIVDKIRTLLVDKGEAEHVFAQIGGGGISSGPGTFSSSAGVNQGAMVAVLNPDRNEKVATIRDRLRPLLRHIPDARLTFDTSGFGAADVQVILTSETGENLDAAALELQREIRTVPGLADPRPATPPSGAELVVRPKPDEAARLGVSATVIASAARIATVGDIDANVPKLDRRRAPHPDPHSPAAEADRELSVDVDQGRCRSADRVAAATTALWQRSPTSTFQAGPAANQPLSADMRDLEIDADGRQRRAVRRCA